jgi:hypothetical protein
MFYGFSSSSSLILIVRAVLLAGTVVVLVVTAARVAFLLSTLFSTQLRTPYGAGSECFRQRFLGSERRRAPFCSHSAPNLTDLPNVQVKDSAYCRTLILFGEIHL